MRAKVMTKDKETKKYRNLLFLCVFCNNNKISTKPRPFKNKLNFIQRIIGIGKYFESKFDSFQSGIKIPHLSVVCRG